jgi:hypothetical protein
MMRRKPALNGDCVAVVVEWGSALALRKVRLTNNRRVGVHSQVSMPRFGSPAHFKIDLKFPILTLLRHNDLDGGFANLGNTDFQ